VKELRLQTERERELERSNAEMEMKIQQLEQKILELEFAISGKLYIPVWTVLTKKPPPACKWPVGRLASLIRGYEQSLKLTMRYLFA